MAEERLYNAAAEGDARILQELLQEDPLVLDRVSYTSSNKTPLHIATIKGHLAFVQQILNYNRHLAEGLDSQQSSALHMASAEGHVEIVQILFATAPDMCMSRDSQGRNPLHLAAIKGHVDVLQELFRVAPFAAREKAGGGLSLLHLCFKHSHFGALETLAPLMNELLNWKDNDGDTILHMAVRDKRILTIHFLLTVDGLEVNAVNLNGMTALDVLIQSRRDFSYSEIKKSLKRAGALRASNTDKPLHNNQHIPANSWKRLFENQADWLAEKKEALMIAASVIATMAFQVGVNPPGGVWQDDKELNSPGNQNISDPKHNQNIIDPNGLAGLSIVATKDRGRYTALYIVNTISFIASLSIILLLMSGLPLRRKPFMWVLMIMTWISITAIALMYLEATYSLVPNNADGFARTVRYSVKWWITLMALILTVRTILLIIRQVKKVKKMLWTTQRRMVAGSAVLGNIVFGLELFLVCISILILLFLSVLIVFLSAVILHV